VHYCVLICPEIGTNSASAPQKKNRWKNAEKQKKVEIGEEGSGAFTVNQVAAY
jgi:hypothetical protein